MSASHFFLVFFTVIVFGFNGCIDNGDESDAKDDETVGSAPAGTIPEDETMTTEEGAEIANDVTGSWLRLTPGTEPATRSYYVKKVGGGPLQKNRRLTLKLVPRQP